MLHLVRAVFDERATSLRAPLIGIFSLLVAANLAAWAWALLVFQQHPIFLGTALLAYGFGLRHAVDADHIAAIDNVTRKLMQEGKRPVSVGFFFAMGHSTVVILAAAGVAATATVLSTHFEQFRSVGGIIGTLVSALFLFAVAAANLIILRSGVAHLPPCQGGRALRGRGFRHPAQQPRRAGPAVPALVPAGHQGLGTCSRSASCSALGSTPRDGGGLARHLRHPGGAGRVDLVDHGVPRAVRRWHVADRHDGRRADAGGVQLGVHQADPQAVLQPHHHPGVSGGGRADRRDRGAGPDRRSV